MHSHDPPMNMQIHSRFLKPRFLCCTDWEWLNWSIINRQSVKPQEKWTVELFPIPSFMFVVQLIQQTLVARMRESPSKEQTSVVTAAWCE